MRHIHKTKLLVIIIFSALLACSCSTGLFSGSAFRRPEKQMAGSKRTAPRVREPRQVRSAKKKQEKNQDRIKKDYQQFVKTSRKRSYEIQSPDVKERMKRNDANIAARDKNKERKTRAASKTRARKFR
jgi:hypothetical protein